MKKYLIVFILGVAVGSGTYWIFRQGQVVTELRDSKLGQKVEERAADRLKAEMEKDGKIVMSKPERATIPTLDDGLLSDLIKAKIAAEPMLADAKLKFDAKSGEVTLSGTATSYEQVGRAMRLAFECDATKTVVSTIEVKAK